MDRHLIKKEEEPEHIRFSIKIENDFIPKKEEHMESSNFTINVKPLPNKRGRKPKDPSLRPPKGVKNVVKNYGKAMCSFALSDIAKPYLEPILVSNRVELKEFNEWIMNNKERIDSIDSLRGLLLPLPEDDALCRSNKKVFQEISEIFLRFFCVNWIYGGKITHKETHLNFRLKMLRRVRNPEQFTYLQNASKKKDQK